jgi:TetR/AcrR family transcriptional regulator, repressor for uid operon
MAMVAQLLRRAAEEHDVRADIDPDVVARFIVSSFTGLQLVTQVLDQRRSLLPRLGEMWQVMLPGIVPARKLPYHLALMATAQSKAIQADPAQADPAQADAA